MKTNKFLTLLITLVVAFAIASCVQDDDYTIPNSLGDEENAGLAQIMQDLNDGTLTEITISELKALYVGTTTLIESEIVVKGYVSSSDQTGNFYKEFYIQDAAENPTAGMGVVLNQVDTYNQFNQGREVYIRLKDLYLGENSSDVTTIGGTNDDGDVEEMTENQIRNHLFRSETTMLLVPLVVTPSSVNDSHLGMFAQFENAQFPSALEGMTFVDPNDDFDTRRPIVSCVDGSEFNLETSSFASFKQMPLPTDARGSISGIITQGFGGSPKVMVLNTPADINFNDSRCDPVFEESFNSAIDNTDLDIPGWTNFAEAGSELWTEQVFSNNGYAEFSSFLSGDAVNIGWLISPGIDMDAQDGEVLSFQTAQHHLDSDANTLEVFVSTDFDGTDVLAATWEPVSANLASMSSSWYAFEGSGPIDVSSYTGKLYVAFKVTGSGTDETLDGAYHVENFAITVL